MPEIERKEIQTLRAKLEEMKAEFAVAQWRARERMEELEARELEQRALAKVYHDVLEELYKAWDDIRTAAADMILEDMAECKELAIAATVLDNPGPSVGDQCAEWEDEPRAAGLKGE
jgi:hypothetical protein